MAPQGKNISSKSFKDRRNEVVTSRMTIVFGLLILSVFVLFYMNNAFISLIDINLKNVVLISRLAPIIPFILFILSLGFFVNRKKHKIDERLNLFPSAFVLGTCTVLLAVSLIFALRIFQGVKPSVVLILLVSILYFIKQTFPSYFFITVSFNAFAVVSIYISNILAEAKTFVLIFLLCLSLSFLCLLLNAKKNRGTVCKKTLFKPSFSYTLILISVILFILLLLHTLIFSASYVAYALIIAAETILFILYYVIKMLK